MNELRNTELPIKNRIYSLYRKHKDKLYPEFIENQFGITIQENSLNEQYQKHPNSLLSLIAGENASLAFTDFEAFLQNVSFNNEKSAPIVILWYHYTYIPYVENNNKESDSSEDAIWTLVKFTNSVAIFTNNETFITSRELTSVLSNVTFQIEFSEVTDGKMELWVFKHHFDYVMSLDEFTDEPIEEEEDEYSKMLAWSFGQE